MNTHLAPRRAESLKFVVCFLSPYFLLYVKCPSKRHWQLARDQLGPAETTDGSVTVKRHPVLLFTSSAKAEAYAQTVLVIEPAPAPRWSMFSLFQSLDSFEELDGPVEVVTVTKRIEIAPVIWDVSNNRVATFPYQARRPE